MTTQTLNIYKDTLEGQVAVVTGAGSGIGAATARLFVEAGARVVLVDRDAGGLAAITQELEHVGSRISLPADVGDASSIQNVYKETIARWGRVDTVFANAGISGFWGALEDFPLEEWNRVMNVNLTGTFLTVKHAVPYLKARGGSVIITASVNGTRMFSTRALRLTLVRRPHRWLSRR